VSNPLKLAALRWAFASVKGIRIQIPWDENKPQYGPYHWGYGKAPRNALLAFTEANCPFNDRWAIEGWMKGQNASQMRVGIDCNGFVYRVLDEAARLSGARPLVETLGTTCEFTPLDMLTPLDLVIERAREIRAGDTFRFNRGRHSGVVIETVTDQDGVLREIWYAHSSFTRGPHIGWIEVRDPNAPVNARMQQWHDQMWDGLTDNGLRDYYFTSPHQSPFYEGARRNVGKLTGIEIRVGNAKVEFPAPPFVLGGVTLAHVRPLAEAMGAQVGWQNLSQTVTLEKGRRSARCQVGSEMAQANGQNVILDEPAMLIDDRVFVPVRFVAEALGFQVVWNGEANRVELSPL
jgi:hypothetical protein